MAARFVRRMLEPYDDDLALRIQHVGAEPIEVDLRPFDVPTSPTVVWTTDDGEVRVLAVFDPSPMLFLVDSLDLARGCWWEASPLDMCPSEHMSSVGRT